MALPWLVLIDTLIDVTNLALSRKPRRPAEDLETSGGPGRANRLELELERERVRAERMLKIELLRQSGDREIGRLRLMAGVAVGSWIGTLLFSTRLIGGLLGARVMLGAGWLLLLAALSLSFAAQSRISRALARIDEPMARHDDLTGGTAGAFVPWLILCGLAVIGFAALIV